MKKSIYIILFAVLYLIVAFVSFYHGCSYMALANEPWMAVILSIAFEIGQAAVLFALLTDKKDRTKVMPWILMTMFTLVQILGNVYSSYKYIVLNSLEDLKYFKEPIFIWTTLPDDQATVIVTFILGAILPIAALMLTGMVTNYLEDDNDKKLEKTEETLQEIETKPEEETIEESPKENTIVKDEPQMITDAASEPVKQVEDVNGKKTHLVSL